MIKLSKNDKGKIFEDYIQEKEKADLDEIYKKDLKKNNKIKENLLDLVSGIADIISMWLSMY